MFSQTVEYALRAFLYIARKSPETVRLREVAEASSAPPRYLAKLLADLARAGLLESTRGPNGGYRIAARDRAATLADIASVFEPVEPRRCLLGHGVCGQNPQCAVHERWAPIATSIDEFFDHTTAHELMRGASPNSPSTST